MKKMLVNVPDSTAQALLDLAKRDTCIVVEYCEDLVEKGLNLYAKCIKLAIQELRDKGILKHPGDYSHVMMVVNQELEKLGVFFYNPHEFRLFMNIHELGSPPGKTSMYDRISMTVGRYPDWTFSDNSSFVETIRRINVAKQFLGAFFRAMARNSDGSSEK